MRLRLRRDLRNGGKLRRNNHRTTEYDTRPSPASVCFLVHTPVGGRKIVPEKKDVTGQHDMESRGVKRTVCKNMIAKTSFSMLSCKWTTGHNYFKTNPNLTESSMGETKICGRNVS